MGIELKLLSLNVRGLREKSKRLQMFNWFQEHHSGKDSFVCLQETHSTPQDETIWEREWGSKIIFDHGSSNKCGVAILFPMQFDEEIKIISSNNGGRKIGLQINLDGETIALVNAYAPTRDHCEEQLNFITSLRNEIENYDDNVIIGGDLNIYIDPVLDKDSTKELVNKASNEINNLMEDFNLIDIWRMLNPQKRRYTWRRRNPVIQSRLDYWLIPNELIYSVNECSIKPSIKSDHSLICLKIKFQKTSPRGPGLWKFNCSLLKNIEYANAVKDIINAHYDISSGSLRWEFIKMKIREFSIKFSKDIAVKRREEERKTSFELLRLEELYGVSPSTEILENIDALQSKIEMANNIKTNGNIIRSRAELVELGEKNTKFFLNLEKRNYKTKHITRLKTSQTEHTDDPQEIIQLQKNFYETLYGNCKRSECFDSIFLDNLPKISPENIQITEKELSLEELNNAIILMKCGKTPGTDGLSVDFYKFFWNDIKDVVLESLDVAMTNNIMSQEQRRAVLRLIPKKDKDITELKNWRPISLLNTDYKLLAQCLAQRLQKVLPDIISKDQNGYIKGRFIGNNVRTIMDVIEKSNKERLNTIIAFLDFEKAFDKLNWQFMDRSLAAFGFGVNFRKFVTVMYTDISSCVINNGFTTPYFKLKCGIRQGCPLSALLFIIAAETLVNSMRQNCNIKGFKLNSTTIKLTQLADDTTLFLQDIQSLHFALNLLFMFYKSSGLRLNYSKTEILHLGHPYSNKENPFNLKWVKERVYALGTWFYKDVELCMNINCESRFNIFQKTLRIWRARHLTWFGKMTVLKSLALAKLNYCIMALPSPKWFVDAVQHEINSFVWEDKPPKIKFLTAIGKNECGGISLTHFESFVKAQKASWIKRLSDNDLPSSQYIKEYLPSMDFNELIQCSLDPDDLSQEIPLFYRQALYSWFEIQNLTKYPKPKSLNDILWFNKNIKIDKISVFYEKWYSNGIVKVKDLTYESKRWLTYDELISKLGFRCNYMQFRGIMHAISNKWSLTNTPIITDTTPCASSSKMYWDIIEIIRKDPSCMKSWKDKYSIFFTKKQWTKIFNMPRLLTFDLRLVELQWKIINRVYATDSYVSNFEQNVSKNCKYCQVQNNLIHWFVECQKLKLFWDHFFNWIKVNFGISMKPNTKCILFGNLEAESFELNFSLLHAKLYIHRVWLQYQGTENHYFSFISFLKKIKYAVCIEFEIAANRNDIQTFNKKFTRIEQCL